MHIPQERRLNKRFVTLNTEYHVHEDTCVGVKCRHSNAWIDDHMAVGHNLSGGLVRTAHGYTPARPGPGSSLWFDAGGRDIVTSTVIEVDRPGKTAVGYYRAVDLSNPALSQPILNPPSTGITAPVM